MTENNFKVQQTILKLDKQFLIEKVDELKGQNCVKDNTPLHSYNKPIGNFLVLRPSEGGGREFEHVIFFSRVFVNIYGV